MGKLTNFLASIANCNTIVRGYLIRKPQKQYAGRVIPECWFDDCVAIISTAPTIQYLFGGCYIMLHMYVCLYMYVYYMYYIHIYIYTLYTHVCMYIYIYIYNMYMSVCLGKLQ